MRVNDELVHSDVDQMIKSKSDQGLLENGYERLWQIIS